ncbi:helix-turn-helix domain-containing protein [Paratractidigestivibacter sp.]|uniref:helix-turn-helix domain-containing protein n=1 Tax=Paratractidigestivibacter sp. TaxID=2847316 RepID=UPI002ABDD862|nr:helix-turn-helix domain-containing protein [Paratractidigestivibacter sp.]
MTAREARRESGVSQKRMAERLGFLSVTLSALETGKNVSSSKIELYLQRLGYRVVVVSKSATVEVRE